MDVKHALPTLEEIKNSRPILRNPRNETNLQLTPLERFAVSITHKVGSMGFFAILATWSIGWLLWNLLAPAEFRFDPAPAFVTWLFISNVIQLILLPLIMVGQNLEGRHSEIRAEADYEINKRAEKEIETIIAYLENHDDMLVQLLNKLDSK
jgi:uncharacterized membrane protein